MTFGKLVVAPPNIEVLRKRLLNRHSGEESLVEERMKNDFTQLSNLKMWRELSEKLLTNYNFEVLLESLNSSIFHIHSHTLEQILTSNPDEIFFVCNHCN